MGSSVQPTLRLCSASKSWGHRINFLLLPSNTCWEISCSYHCACTGVRCSFKRTIFKSSFWKYKKKTNLAALILQARKSGSLIHCITNIMQFKNMESFVLFRHDWVFLCTRNSKLFGKTWENEKIWDFYILDTTFLHILCSFWFAFSHYFMLNNKAQIHNTNTWVSHFIISHFAAWVFFWCFFHFLSCCVTLCLLFFMFLGNYGDFLGEGQVIPQKLLLKTSKTIQSY